eukprot:1159237-Pelagomonas_calceolata.AAC.2
MQRNRHNKSSHGIGKTVMHVDAGPLASSLECRRGLSAAGEQAQLIIDICKNAMHVAAAGPIDALALAAWSAQGEGALSTY